MKVSLGAIVFAISIAGFVALAGSPQPVADTRSHGHTVTTSADDIGILGLKFRLTKSKQMPEVERVFPDTPAAKGDVREGDVIIDVDGIPIRGWDKEQIYSVLTGPPGTKVVLKLQRQSTTLTKSLTRMHSSEFAKAHPEMWKLYARS
ncbi:MAG TPA: PDZ domain-containing protein [Planktothrix sp.]|jgi:C-terminal processing protease CtpA/Prc